MKATLIRNTLLVAAMAASVSSCSKSDKPNAEARRDSPRSVKTAIAAVRPMERVVPVTGSLAAQEAATISVKVAGRVKAINVDLGTAVERGDVMAQVEPRDYELRLQQASAALAQARATVGLPLDGDDDRFDPEKISSVKQAQAVLDEAAKNRTRLQSLFKAGIAPPAELDTAESAWAVALNRYEVAVEEGRTRQAVLAQRRAEFELAAQQLADTSVRAPFNGAVQTRIANLGEFLSAGSPVVMLVKSDPLRLRLEVPERQAAGIRLGQRVQLRVEGDTNVYTGQIARLSPALEEQTRMLKIEADAPNYAALRPGLFVKARIVTQENDEGLAVPLSALITFAGLEKVIVVEDGKAVEKTVVTGRSGLDWIELVSGLKPREVVVLDPGNLRSGQAVIASEPTSLHTSRATNESGY